MDGSGNKNGLSEYEQYVLTALYRQYREETGHAPGITERERIRREWLASTGKDASVRRAYRKQQKPRAEMEVKEFRWQAPLPMRKIRPR